MILYLNLDLLENTGKYLVFFYQKGTQRIIYCPATSKIMLFDIRLDMKKSLFFKTSENKKASRKKITFTKNNNEIVVFNELKNKIKLEKVYVNFLTIN